MMVSKRSLFRRLDDALCAFAFGHSVEALKAKMIENATGELGDIWIDSFWTLAHPVDEARAEWISNVLPCLAYGFTESRRCLAEAILLDFFEVFLAAGRVRKPMILVRRELMKHVLDGHSRLFEALLVGASKLDCESDEGLAKIVGLHLGLDEERFGAGYGHIVSFFAGIRNLQEHVIGTERAGQFEEAAE